MPEPIGHTKLAEIAHTYNLFVYDELPTVADHVSMIKNEVIPGLNSSNVLFRWAVVGNKIYMSKNDEWQLYVPHPPAEIHVTYVKYTEIIEDNE